MIFSDAGADALTWLRFQSMQAWHHPMITIFRGDCLAIVDQGDERIGSRNMPKPDSRNVEAYLLG